MENEKYKNIRTKIIDEFNNNSFEKRSEIIEYELVNEIDLLERMKMKLKANHKKELDYLNDRIKKIKNELLK